MRGLALALCVSALGGCGESAQPDATAADAAPADLYGAINLPRDGGADGGAVDLRRAADLAAEDMTTVGDLTQPADLASPPDLLQPASDLATSCAATGGSCTTNAQCCAPTKTCLCQKPGDCCDAICSVTGSSAPTCCMNYVIGFSTTTGAPIWESACRYRVPAQACWFDDDCASGICRGGNNCSDGYHCLMGTCQ